MFWKVFCILWGKRVRVRGLERGLERGGFLRGIFEGGRKDRRDRRGRKGRRGKGKKRNEGEDISAPKGKGGEKRGLVGGTPGGGEGPCDAEGKAFVVTEEDVGVDATICMVASEG